MDSRFHLKVDFSIYGKDFKWDASLNWSADDGEIDSRITEWFLKCYEDGYAKHCQEEAEFFAQQEAERLKESQKVVAMEIAELRRLREKYPDAIGQVSKTQPSSPAAPTAPSDKGPSDRA